MEPFSVLALFTASGKIIETCGSIFISISQIRKRYIDIPRALDAVAVECRAINYSMTRIKDYIDSHKDFLRADEEFRLVTYSGLGSCSRIIEKIAEEVGLLSQQDSSSKQRWKKFRSTLGDSVIKTYLEELRWQSLAVRDLFQIFQLPRSQQVDSLVRIKRDYNIHSSSSSFIESGTASIFSNDADIDSDSGYRLPLPAPRPSPQIMPRELPLGSKSNTARSRKSTSSGQLTPPPPHTPPKMLVTKSKTRQATDSRQWPNREVALRLLVILLGLCCIYWVLSSIYSHLMFDPVSECFPEANDPCILCCPASKGEYYVVRKLLKHGHRASARDDRSLTPLHHAAINGDVNTIKLLLEQRDSGWLADRMTPLHLAARYGNTNAVKVLANVDGHQSWRERSVDREATAMLRNSSQVFSAPQFDPFFKRKTFTARELAVIFGHSDSALALPERWDDDLLVAFSCACMMGDMFMVEDLWRSNEQRSWPHNLLKQARWFPAPPLHLAILSKSRSAVDYLLERKGVDIADQKKKAVDAFPAYSPPAHYAAMAGLVPVLRMLHSKGAEVHVKDGSRRTSLSHAVEHRQEDVVEYLLDQFPEQPDSFWSSKQIPDWYLGSGHPWQTSPDTGLHVLGPNTPRIIAALKLHNIVQP